MIKRGVHYNGYCPGAFQRGITGKEKSKYKSDDMSLSDEIMIITSCLLCSLHIRSHFSLREYCILIKILLFRCIKYKSSLCYTSIPFLTL